jgi:hypothetical protein
MRSIGTLLIASALAASSASVHAHESCRASVLQSQLSPSALLSVLPSSDFGAWLVTATLEVRTSIAPPWIVTLREILPFQMTLRHGEVFRVPCEYALSNRLTLSALATAPSFRSAHSAYYARLR